MKEGFFDANGVSLNYVEGNSNGPALVLIPGQSATWKNYEPVFNGLRKYFHVFSLSIRGHGKSDWTTGDYNFNSIGRDLVIFLKEIVKKPAILSGNSSGGLISLWIAVNKPELVKGIVLEDAPLFSAEWLRIKKEFVYEALSKIVKYLGKKEKDYYGFFKSIKKPLSNGRERKLPEWLCKFLAWLVRNRNNSMSKLILKFMPRTLRTLVNILPTFDPDFSRAWIDGRVYKGLNHEEALRKIKCPLLILHADWYRTEKGLVGAMDDEDAKRALELVPHAEYFRLKSKHVIHTNKPKEFVKIIKKFADKIK